MATSQSFPDYRIEESLLSEGYIIGVDEAGRGPWAGPVCAAAFWIDPRFQDKMPKGLHDSKKISAKKRIDIEAQLYDLHDQGFHDFEAATASVDEIDTLGILPANFAAMGRAVDRLAKRLLHADPLGLAKTGTCQIGAVLVDGNLVPPLPYPATAYVKGDGRILSIAAASLIAKQTRDAIMAELHCDYPHYGWDSNQGYGTKAHQQGLDRHGITPHHRKSFAPIKKRLPSS